MSLQILHLTDLLWDYFTQVTCRVIRYAQQINVNDVKVRVWTPKISKQFPDPNNKITNIP